MYLSQCNMTTLAFLFYFYHWVICFYSWYIAEMKLVIKTSYLFLSCSVFIELSVFIIELAEMKLVIETSYLFLSCSVLTGYKDQLSVFIMQCFYHWVICFYHWVSWNETGYKDQTSVFIMQCFYHWVICFYHAVF